MNKIFKYILGIIPLIIGVSYCNAEFLGSGDRVTASTSTNTTISGNLVCVQNGGTNWTNDKVIQGNNEYKRTTRFSLMCFNGEITIVPAGSNSLLTYELINGPDLNPTCPSCPTCEEQYTSLECQTEYNLIPIESVTANYCHVNFGLIDPASCPINEGTGTINWSSLYINETQYSANDSIRLGIPEFIAWNLTYNTGETIIEIEGYNADTEYMDSIIAQTELTPTAEDMSTMINGLQVYLPYFFIGLICLFFLGLVKKFFRS